MKKSNILLVAFFGFNLISCTDEPVDFQQETGELIEVEERNYEGGEIESVSITKFNDQRPQMVTEYDASGEVFSIARLSYNAADLLVSIKVSSTDGIVFYEEGFTYDNANRIIQTTVSASDEDYFQTNNFTYNPNATITSSTEIDGEIFSKTFVLNPNSIITREIEDGEVIYSVEFNNLLPISKTNFGNTSTFSYLEEGSESYAFVNYFGGNPNNVVLYYNNLGLAVDQFTDKLISKIESNFMTEEYEYTLNGDGFPLTKKYYVDGELSKESIYTYK